LFTAGMHRSEHRNRKHRTPRLSAPRQPLSSATGSTPSRTPQFFFRSGPDARADLSLACNESRFHGFHSRVKAFCRPCCKLARLPKLPDSRSLPDADFYY
jgi:hypothetical protein